MVLDLIATHIVYLLGFVVVYELARSAILSVADRYLPSRDRARSMISDRAEW